MIGKQWLDTHDWMLRSSSNGVSYRGFQWEKKGEWTKAKSWDSSPICGDGLHGNAPEAHGFGLYYARVELCETKGKRVVVQGDKIKVPEARIVAENEGIPQEAFEQCGMTKIMEDCTITPNDGDWYVIFRGNVTVKDQQGGECQAYDKATINSENQQGGWCRAYYDKATINSENQQGGWCRAYYDKATINYL